MRVLFLDIDGVLIPWGKGIEPAWSKPCLEQLDRITWATGCFIVLSSAWRFKHSVFTINHLFRGLGINAPVIALTDPSIQHREGAIMDTLKRHGDMFTQYAIVDDELLLDFPGHFFRTKSNVGLTEEIADEIISLLGSMDSK